MKCPTCGRMADPRGGRCIVLSKRQDLPEHDQYGRQLQRVPAINALIYECMSCGWSAAGIVHDGVWLQDDDLVPLTQVFSQLMEYNEHHQNRQRPGRHEPGE